MQKIFRMLCICLLCLIAMTTLAFAAANPINPAALPAASVAPGSPTAEYLQSIKAMRDNKFNENDIQSFVYQVLSLFDRQVDPSQLSVFFSEDDLHIQVPDAKADTHQEFLDWYSRYRAKYQSNIHSIEKLSVSIPSKGNYRVSLTLLRQAVDTDGKFIAQRLTEKWSLVDGSGYWPRITEYRVQIIAP